VNAVQLHVEQVAIGMARPGGVERGVADRALIRRALRLMRAATVEHLVAEGVNFTPGQVGVIG
jgi:hypothetical protein